MKQLKELMRTLLTKETYQKNQGYMWKREAQFRKAEQ